MKSIVALLATSSLVCLVGLGVRSGAPDRPIASLQGSYSAITTPRTEVIGDPARWEAVWKEHKGDKLERTAHGFDVVFRVDFSRCMVFAAFSGNSTNGSGIDVPEVLTRDGHTVIRYDRVGFQTLSVDGPDHGVPTTEYGFAILPRTDLPLILEENTQNLIGKPPIWTERKRIPALPPQTDKPQRGN